MALVGIELVVVHGGGPQVSEAMTQAGIEPSVHRGTARHGCPDSMEIVRRVLVGSINSDLVSPAQRGGTVGGRTIGRRRRARRGRRPTRARRARISDHVGEVTAVDPAPDLVAARRRAGRQSSPALLPMPTGSCTTSTRTRPRARSLRHWAQQNSFI